MERYRLDHDWKFHLGDIQAQAITHTQSYMAAKAGGAMGGGNPDFETSACKSVNLPHDWAVECDFDEQYGPARGYKPRGKGWYFKKFRLDEADKNKELYIEFGGVSSHCIVYLNGSVVYRNFCGYNSFVVNITDMALYGEEVNTLAVFVDAEVTEGWWYEGAGIYRHVDLYKYEKTHIKPWGVFVNPRKKSADVWEITTKTTVVSDAPVRVKSYVVNEENNIVAKAESIHDVASQTEITQTMLTYSPYLWDVDDVHLYTMVTELYQNDVLCDTLSTRFGFRTISIDADKGFFLNDKPIKLYGTCNHQDHAGVGVAVPDSINEYRIKLLKSMGTNAYRCSHGNVDRQILDLCDEYGLLVMDETRNFNTSPDGLQQVRDMVIRDRNHPSVVMYSVLNEEPLQGSLRGQKLANRMVREIKLLDDTRFTVAAMNGGFLEDESAAHEVDIAGLNYCTAYYDEFRKKYPNKPMVSSETDSAFQTRGIYKTNHEKHEIDCYDSEAAPWGNIYRDGFKQVDTRDWVMGMFIWTGFDYRGEPTPFEYPSISTQFGIMDTCGFKKDAYYLNKAFFTKNPMVHILPHWNHNDGDKVKVMVYTNCTEVQLFLNNRPLEKKSIDKYDMQTWTVDYEAGELKAVGTLNGESCTDIKLTAQKPVKIIAEPYRNYFQSGCDDAVAVNISLVDENGTLCPNADDLVEFSGENINIIGVGNGDPNSHENDKFDKRRLFNGHAQVIAEKTDGEGTLFVKCGELTTSVHFDIRESERINYLESVKEKYVSTWRKNINITDTMPDTKKEIADHDMNTWEVFTPGAFTDPMFDKKCGYGQYRTVTTVTKSHTKLILNEVFADTAIVYIDGKEITKKECWGGAKIEIPITDKEGEINIAVVLYSTLENQRTGLCGAVVIVE